MNWPIIIRPRAESDLLAAKLWYEQQRAGLGEEFLADFERTLWRLAEHPERHPFYYRGFRRILLRRFPYKLFYRTDKEQVLVFRVLHVKQEHTHRLGA